MSNQLQENLNLILEEKNTKLLPENLKVGITCLGITGELEEGVDTSDATATANDIAQYKTAYINGEKVEGTVWDGRPGATNITGEEPHIGVNLENVQYHIDEDIASFGGWLEFKGRFNTSCILDERCVLVMDEEGMHVADAIGLTADKIVSGNTILGVEGTAESGIDTSDATATSDDIISGKTAYVNGEKVEGTILDIGEGLSVGFQYENVVNIGPENGLYITSVHPDDVTFAIRKNAQTATYLPYADAASAIGLTSNKIVSGNTVLGIEGTATTGVDTSDATATSDDIVSGKSAYVNGQKVEGTIRESEIAESSEVSLVFVGAYDDNLYMETTFSDTRVHRAGSVLGVSAHPHDVANAIGLMPDMIVEGNRILGIEGMAITGVDTSDATATSSDILVGTSAYVNGERVEGTLETSTVDNALVMNGIQVSDSDATLSFEVPETKVIQAGDGFWPSVPFSEIVASQGITPDMIVEGNSILGIDGTATTGSEVDYSNFIFITGHEGSLPSYTPKGDEPRKLLVYEEPTLDRSNPNDYIRVIQFPEIIVLDSPMESMSEMHFFGEGEDLTTVSIEVYAYPEAPDSCVYIFVDGDAIGSHSYHNVYVKYTTKDGITYIRENMQDGSDINTLEYSVDYTLYLPFDIQCTHSGSLEQIYDFLQIVRGGYFYGVYTYNDNTGTWMRDPLPTTALPTDVSEGKTFVGVHGLSEGMMSSKERMTFFKYDDTHIQNLGVLVYDYEELYSDGQSTEIYGKIISYRQEDDELIVDISVKNERVDDLDVMGNLMCTVEFYDVNGEMLPEGNFYSEVVNTSSIIVAGSREIISLRTQIPLSDPCLSMYRARTYKIWFDPQIGM